MLGRWTVCCSRAIASSLLLLIMSLIKLNLLFQDVGSMDPHFVKLFKLAQLTIEYLLHSQDYLSGMVAAMEEKLRKAMEVGPAGFLVQ